MRTSLLETRRIEEHLLKTAEPGDQLLFQAELILDSSLREKVKAQQETYALVQAYGREKLKEEIADVHAQLFSLPFHQRFKQRILLLFPNT